MNLTNTTIKQIAAKIAAQFDGEDLQEQIQVETEQGTIEIDFNLLAYWGSGYEEHAIIPHHVEILKSIDLDCDCYVVDENGKSTGCRFPIEWLKSELESILI
jgi:hypothetical protein